MLDECPWKPEEINSDQFLLRHVSPRQTEKVGGRRYPGPDHFMLREDIGETYLSFNWESYADAERCHVLIGISFGDNEEFRKPDGVIHFKYPVEFLETVRGFEKVEHIPEWSGNPSPVGRPNNKSHTGLFCQVFGIATRSQLSEYCHDYPDTRVKLNFNIIREKVEELKKRENNTPYHRDWIFDCKL